MARQDWARQLLVNMEHVKYLSSTGFAILFNLVKQARDQSTTVKFCGFHPEVRIGPTSSASTSSPRSTQRAAALESFAG